jgi:lipopolysaccharide biosynthesis glycosyltransferase
VVRHTSASFDAKVGQLTERLGSGSEYALVFAASESYAPGLAVAVYSSLTTLSPSIQPGIWILGSDLSETTRARLLKVVRAAGYAHALRWISVPAERLEHLAGGNLPPASFARLLITDYLPQDVRRAVYLDADVLVRGDLAPLFTVELGAAVVGAVRDFGIGTTAHEASGVRERVPARPYFNSGVLVIDLPGWRETGLADRALQYAAAGDELLRWAEQDALNAVVEAWHELEYKWNTQHTPLFASQPPPADEISGRLYDQRWEIYRTASVLHFTGRKPWYGSCTTPGWKTWGRALVRSRWYTRTESMRWVLRYRAQRARYWLGTRRRRWGLAGGRT